MPDGNPLVARAQNQTTAVTGIGIAESAQGLASGVSSGDWVEAGLSAAGVGLEVLSLVIDPLGTLASYGVSWLIEHVRPLKEALDWFAGDPPVIQSFSETWGNVAAEVGAVAADLSSQSGADTAGWSGVAGDAYRGHVAEVADAISGAGTLAEGISVGVMIMGEVVAFVREFIRDMVGELVGRLIAWALEVAATLGLATPVVVAQATAAISKVVKKITDVVRKLVKTIGNVTPRIRKIIDKLDEIIAKLAKLMRRGDAPSKTPDATTTPSSTTIPSSTTTPDTPSSSTTPSSTPDTPGTPDKPGSTSPSSADPNTSPNRPTDPSRDAVPERERVCVNDPIDVVSGDMVLTYDDVTLPGVLPLVLSRTHVSSYRAGRTFGRSWASTVDQRLEVDDHGVVFLTEDGMALVYPHPPERGEVLPVIGPRLALSRTETGFAVRPHGSTTVLRFTATGRVCPLTAITDSNANRIDFDRDAAGTLIAVRHSAGYRLDLVHRSGRLTELRLGDVTVVRYGHDTAGRLTEVINSSGRPLRFDYDHADRIIRWTDRNESWYRYEYDEAGRCVANEGSGGVLNGTFAYADGRTTFTDALSHTTTYTYNARHRVVGTTDALGNTTTQDWDDAGRLVASTDPFGNTTRFAYDTNGNLITTTRPDGARTISEYDDAGRVTTFVAPDGAAWRQEYDDRGNLVAETDPTGVVTRYECDEHGHRVAVTDMLGNVTRVDTNAAGLPVSVLDPTGARTRYEYDVFGRPTTVVDPLGRATRFTWTVEGQLRSRTGPDGATERWRHDPEGNEIEHVDRRGALTRTRVTHFALPIEEIRPDGSVYRFAYDQVMRLVSVTNAAGRTWTYTHDAVGNVLAERDFDGRERTYRYDANGRQVERLNGAGQTVRITRDLFGRMVERRAEDEVTRFTYDPVGRVSHAVNGDTVLIFTRDAAGRVLTETINGRTVTSRYDGVGRRTWRRTPTGAQSRWDYDEASRPARLTVGSRAVSFRYDLAGQQVARAVGDMSFTQSWDTNRRLTSQTATGPGGPALRRGYRYRDDELAEVADPVSPRHYRTNQLGRVTAVDGPDWTERYDYDADGNLATDTTRAGTLVVTARDAHYTYDREGRVVVRRRKRLSRKPDVWHYRWNADDRLVGVTTPDGTRWTYRYDPFGRRVAKVRHAADGSPVEQVDFAWDGSELVEQSHSSGRATFWEYDPASAHPLTQTERVRAADQTWVDERFYAIVTNLVGTPTELLDEHGAVAWQARHTLWGDGSGAGRADTPLRFPGQYFDRETGLHYNYLRYYDPVSAGYLSPDPLGLAGGPSPHAYVHNPTGWTDALGLTETGGGDYVDPNLINFSQRTIEQNNYADLMRLAPENGGWDWNRPDGAIQVMEIDGQLVAYSNRRLDAAREVGGPVRVERVNPNDIFPNPQTGEPTSKTWAQKFQERFTSARNRGPNGEPIPRTGIHDRPTAYPPAQPGQGRRNRRRGQGGCQR